MVQLGTETVSNFDSPSQIGILILAVAHGTRIASAF